MRVAVIGIALAALACGTPRDESAAAVTASFAADGAAPHRTYSLTLDTDSSLDGHGRFLQFELHGTLVVDRLEKQGGDATLAVRVERPEITTEVESARSDLAVVATALEQECRWSWDKQGRLSAIDVAADTDPLAVGILRTLAATVQLSLPAQPAREWQADEVDNTGRYLALYRSLGPTAIERRKTKYLAMNGAGNRALPVTSEAVPNGARTAFELDAGGQLIGVRADETVTVTTSNFPRSTSIVHVELRLLQAGDARPATPSSSTLVRIAASEPYNPLAGRAATTARAGGYSYERAMQELDALGEPQGDSDPNKDARARLFSALRGVFATDDAAVEKALWLIGKGSAHSQALIEALRGSENPRATQGLVELLGHEVDEQTEGALVRGLSLLQRPDAKATQALLDRLNHPRLGTQAAYGIGAHARSALGLGDLGRAKELLQFLLAKLRATSDAALQERYLRALGNASNPEVAEHLQLYLASERPSIRRAALQALTNVKSAAAAKLMISASTDSEPRVRAEAAKLAGNQEHSEPLVQALANMAQGDSELEPRYAAVKSLGRFLPASAEARKTLESIAANDASESHRALARSLLEKQAPGTAH